MDGKNNEFAHVHRLSTKEKREFYSGLARLIRSGSSLPSALELLAKDTPRGLGQFLNALNTRIKSGEPIGDALLGLRPKVSALEANIVTASSRGGRLDHGCDQLARYFEALERARGELVKRLLYPILLLHFGALFLPIRYLFTSGLEKYLQETLTPLAYMYAGVAILWLGWQALVDAARHNVAADRFIRRIPGIGPIREKFALARFFATLDAQLEATVNVWDAFANAARTSDSARIISAAREGMPMLQSGSRLSEILAAKKVIPAEYIRSFRVAEQTGELDEELTLLAKKTEELAVAALERWSEWLPRVAYGMVLLYTGWQIVQTMQAYVNTLNSFMPF